MCGRKTSSNAARSSLLCTIETDVRCWPDNRSEPSGRSINTAFLSSVHPKFVRCTDRVKVMSDAPRVLKALQSLYDDFPLHVRMQAAEIVERAGTGERKGIRVVSVERLRPKGLILVDYIVRNVVVIDPFHRCSNGDGQLRRGEGEVVDRNDIFLLRRDRAERQQRTDGRTQKHRNDHGTTGSESRRDKAEMVHESLHVEDPRFSQRASYRRCQAVYCPALQ